MVNYLSSAKKHAFDTPYIAFKLYSKIVVPIWVDLDPCLNRSVVGAYFRILKKVLEISTSSPS